MGLKLQHSAFPLKRKEKRGGKCEVEMSGEGRGGLHVYTRSVFTTLLKTALLPSALARGIESRIVARFGSKCCMYVCMYVCMYFRHAFGMQLVFDKSVW